MAEPTKPARNTVWVECNLPNGIVLYLEREGYSPTGHKIKAPVEAFVVDGGRVKTTPNVVRLNGANAARVIGGYGMTEVSADFWEAWLATHKDFAPLVAGAIKAQSTRERAAAQALDEEKLRTGFERIDPKNPGKGLNPVSEEEQKAAAAMASF